MQAGAITVSDEALRAFCAEHRIRSLKIFGSALRDDFTSESDIVLLVEFEPETKMKLFRFNEIERALSALFGRKAELNTPDSLSKYFRDEVLKEAKTLYAAA